MNELSPIEDTPLDFLEAAGLGGMRAKANPIVFHDLRHTFGTQCAARNIDLRRIQAWMGHADIQTTQRYLHHVPQHDDAARLTLAFTSEPLEPGTQTFDPEPGAGPKACTQPCTERPISPRN